MEIARAIAMCGVNGEASDDCGVRGKGGVSDSHGAEKRGIVTGVGGWGEHRGDEVFCAGHGVWV